MRTREPILEKEQERGGPSAHAAHDAVERAGAGQGIQGKRRRRWAWTTGRWPRAWRAGKLSRRVRSVLEKELLSGGGSPAAEQRERNDRLEGRVEEVEGRVEELSKDTHRGPRSRPGRGQGAQERARPGDTAVGTAAGAGWKRAGAFRARRRRRSAQPGSRRGGPRSGGSIPSL